MRLESMNNKQDSRIMTAVGEWAFSLLLRLVDLAGWDEILTGCRYRTFGLKDARN